MALGRRPCAPELITSIVCEFIFPVTASWTLKEREAAWGKMCEHASYGDVDNLLKPVCDTLQEMGWIVNDKQIGAMFGVKRYQISPDEKPKTIVTLLARA